MWHTYNIYELKHRNLRNGEESVIASDNRFY